jgi:hypothetical protein
MDTRYDLAAGVLTMGMDTYIQSTMDRFATFDLTLGVPYREIVGCLLWIVLCVVGPELIRVKDLERRNNAPTLSDYHDAVKVLKKFTSVAIQLFCSSVDLLDTSWSLLRLALTPISFPCLHLWLSVHFLPLILHPALILSPTFIRPSTPCKHV